MSEPRRHRARHAAGDPDAVPTFELAPELSASPASADAAPAPTGTAPTGTAPTEPTELAELAEPIEPKPVSGHEKAAPARASARPGTSLEASRIDVGYDDVTAVRQLSIAVHGGDLIAVTGPSGAGKTSLLSALAGVQQPQDGGVWLDGVQVRDRDDAAHRGVVLIPQGNALVRVLTAAENVAIPLVRFPGKKIRDAKQRSLAVLDQVGLGEASEQLLEELSGGQQQRVAVARGLVEQGRFVLADEPTSELDSTNRDRMMRLFRAEADRGAGVVVATHDPDAAAVCDAELRLDEGVGTWVRDDR